MENNITYRVPEMSTGHCEAAVTEEVSKVCGVAAIDEAGYEAVIA